MKIFETLYKRTGTGAIQEWSIKVVSNPDDSAHIVSKYGQLGGKLREDDELITEGKNIGRSNETTPYEQAISEAESTWKKKKDKGYKSLVDLRIIFIENSKEYAVTEPNKNSKNFKTLEQALNFALPKVNTDALGIPKPMLADKYWKPGTRELTSKGKKVKFPVLAQPKYNGNRCLAMRIDEDTIRYSSREGKVLQNFAHITKELLQIMPIGETWDGELYIHGMSLQSLRSGIARFNPDITPKLEYRVYDIAEEDTEQKERIYNLMNAFDNSFDRNYVHLSPSTELISHKEVEIYHDSCIKDGYEGAVLRPIDAEYNFNGRSTMLKVKNFYDDEFEIVGWEQGKREQDVMVHCLTNKGQSFKPTAIGTAEEKKTLTKVIDESFFTHEKGLYGTVRYFELSDDGIPCHCNFIAIRDGKE